MAKPLIGITCGPYTFRGQLYYGVLPAYTRSVVEAGGLPVMIAPDLGEAALRELFDRVDGMLVPGGGDVDPARYGMSGDGLVYGVSAVRDAAEITVVNWAAEANKPLLGICRGCQVINVARGGTLYRDIAKEYAPWDGTNHDQSSDFMRNHFAHAVSITPESHLAGALGANQVAVNSLHHQAVRDLGQNLTVAACSEDGLIEGVELPTARFFVGVQWHPEELTVSDTPSGTAMRRLFATFVRACSNGANDGANG